MTWLLRIGRARVCVAQIVAYGLVSGLSPAVASGECPLLTVSQAMAYPSSVAAFSGIVREVKSTGGAVQIVTFDVQRVWKGTLTKRIALYQVTTDDSIKFWADVPYVIVAYRGTDLEREQFRISPPPGMLGIMICGSRSLEDAERRGYLRELGPGRLIR
jgi:hypothetical protein